MTAVSLWAHNGGIDEIALVGGPIVLIGGLLWLANRRASQMEQLDDDAAPSRREP